MVLSMKTMPLLWLHTTFKWTAQQGLPQSTGLWDLDGGQNSGKYSKRRALCAPSSSVCWGLCRLAHVSLNPTHTSLSIHLICMFTCRHGTQPPALPRHFHAHCFCTQGTSFEAQGCTRLRTVS